MKYSGPSQYKAHVLGDVEAALRDLRAAGFKADARPVQITLQETRGTRRISGEFYTSYNGAWGRGWNFYAGRGRSRIELVTWPDGRANRDWRRTVRHEVMHAVMDANGIATRNSAAQHDIMTGKLRGWM